MVSVIRQIFRFVTISILLFGCKQTAGRDGDNDFSWDANSLQCPITYHILNDDNDTTLQVIDRNLNMLFSRESLKGGFQVAISKYGKVVYAKGFGYSDLEDSVEMQPYNVMRIASVSKLITAVAVMRLVDEGKISLDQRVFGPVGILNDDIYTAYADSRWADITVRHLLNHSGGWTSRWGDPMFIPHSIARQMGKRLTITIQDIIRFMMDKRLHFDPGTSSVYCNFGYGILGEVVAKVAGMPYEDYVRGTLLAPLGIYDMYIGHSHREHALPFEVKYYEADSSAVAIDYSVDTTVVYVRRSYGGSDIHTLGSAGGWVASAVDLLKLTLAIDGYDDVPDILTKESVDIMVERESGFDPLGWRTTVEDNWYRSGTLAATAAMVARRPDGVCYVVLINSGNHRGPVLANLIRQCMDKSISELEGYPSVDLLANDEVWQYRTK